MLPNELDVFKVETDISLPVKPTWHQANYEGQEICENEDLNRCLCIMSEFQKELELKRECVCVHNRREKKEVTLVCRQAEPPPPQPSIHLLDQR